MLDFSMLKLKKGQTVSAHFLGPGRQLIEQLQRGSPLGEGVQVAH